MALYVLSNAYRKPGRCLIRVGAAQRLISAPYGVVTEVTVESRCTGPAQAVLTLTARHPADSRNKVREAGIFAPGEPLLIEADCQGRPEEILRGSISDIRAEYAPQSRHPSRVIVECRDESLRLDRAPMRWLWGEQAPLSDRAIAAAILRPYGLTLEPAGGQGASGMRLLQDETDLSFLHRRAQANGYELRFRAGKVYFGPARWQARPQPAIRVSDHCRQLTVRCEREPSDQLILHRAQGELDGHAYGHVLRAGEPVGVAGVSARHDGIYYADTIVHRFTAAGYRQAFTLLRRTCGEALGDIAVTPQSAAAGRLYDVL